MEQINLNFGDASKIRSINYLIISTSTFNIGNISTSRPFAYFILLDDEEMRTSECYATVK